MNLNEKVREIHYENEDDLDAGVVVFYKDKPYITGNRYHDEVELYYCGKFITTTKIKEVYSQVYKRNCPGHGTVPVPFETTVPREHFCKECREALDKLVSTFNRCTANLEGGDG